MTLERTTPDSPPIPECPAPHCPTQQSLPIPIPECPTEESLQIPDFPIADCPTKQSLPIPIPECPTEESLPIPFTIPERPTKESFPLTPDSPTLLFSESPISECPTQECPAPECPTPAPCPSLAINTEEPPYNITSTPSSTGTAEGREGESEAPTMKVTGHRTPCLAVGGALGVLCVILTTLLVGVGWVWSCRKKARSNER